MAQNRRTGPLARDAMAYVLAGGRGSRLMELTDRRAIAEEEDLGGPVSLAGPIAKGGVRLWSGHGFAFGAGFKHPGVRVALQPRLTDLAAQTAWFEESLVLTDALFLVLGSSFAESIDLLGGRVTHAMVVGPALPEVNAVQRARIAELRDLGREAAFRRVYQIPGMAKVNQALGRLVRAPGQRARVLLHCRRFAELSYAQLLARDYQFGQNIATDSELTAWLDQTCLTPQKHL
jgi:hypothetical protein